MDEGQNVDEASVSNGTVVLQDKDGNFDWACVTFLHGVTGEAVGLRSSTILSSIDIVHFHTSFL